MIDKSLPIEKLMYLVKDELSKSYLLKYVPNDSILISGVGQNVTKQQFKTFLINISPSVNGFYRRIPQIGNFFKNEFSLTIELFIKTSIGSAKSLTETSTIESIGITEFFENVVSILEHNTLNNNVDPYPGSNIGNPTYYKDNEAQTEGIQFDFVAVQHSRN